MPIETLIDKRDALEVVRDAIATILLAETASQQSLATAASRDPRLWELRVFSDSSQPLPQFLEQPEQLDGAPVVNVVIDTTEIDRGASELIERQQRRLTFSVDCYGYGVSQGAGAAHVPGDLKAAQEALRAARLVRNVLMSGNYAYLGLRGFVGRRMIRSITAFQPETKTKTSATAVWGVRLTMDVTVAETSPQVVPVGVETVRVELRRETVDGELYIEADWPTTAYSHPAPVAYADPSISAVTIGELIDKQDSLETVRAAIANILATETAAQQQLATNAGEDPRRWALRAFEDRRQPWADFLDAAHKRSDQLDVPPVVNVRFDNATVDPRASDPIWRQTYDAQFHLDVFAFGLSEDNGAGGYHVGDQRAAAESQRGARLVRNILMAAQHAYLGMRGTVGRRFIGSTQSYQAEPLEAVNVAGVRLVLNVRMAETSPQIAAESVAGVDVDVTRLSTGEVLFSASWDATP